MQSITGFLTKHHPRSDSSGFVPDMWAGVFVVARTLGMLFLFQGSIWQTHAQDRTLIERRDAIYYRVQRQWGNGEYDDAIAGAEKILELERQAFGDIHAEVAGTFHMLAEIYMENDDFASAERNAAEAVKLRAIVYGVSHWRTVESRSVLDYSKQLASFTKAQRDELREAGRLNGQAIIHLRNGEVNKSIEYSEMALSSLRKLFSASHPNVAAAEHNLAAVYFDLNQYDKAEPLFRSALATLQQSLGIENPKHTRTLIRLADCMQILSDQQINRYSFVAAEKSLKEVLSIRQNVDGETHYRTKDVIAALETLQGMIKASQEDSNRWIHSRKSSHLITAYTENGNVTAALPLAKELVTLNEQLFGRKHFEYAIAVNNLGHVYSTIGDFENAEKYLREAIVTQVTSRGENHPDTANFLRNLGDLCFEAGNYREAIDLQKRALGICLKVHGREHISTARIHVRIGRSFDKLAELPIAKQHFTEALAIRKEIFGPRNAELVESFNDLGQVALDLRQLQDAADHFGSALEISREKHGESHANTAVILSNLARVLHEAHQYTEAHELYDEALLRLRSSLGDSDPRTITCLSNFGAMLEATEKFPDAVRVLNEALNAFRKLRGNNQPDVAATLFHLAKLYHEMGDDERSVSHVKEAISIYTNSFGDTHPFTCAAHERFAEFQLAAHDSDGATASLDRCQRGLNQYVNQQLVHLPENEQLVFLEAKFRGSFQRALGSVCQFGMNLKLRDSSAEWLINGKGIAQTVLAKQQLLAMTAVDAESVKLRDELLRLRSSLAALAFRPPSESEVMEHRDLVRQLKEKERIAARDLKLHVNNEESSTSWVDWSDVRGTLPKSAVYIDIARISVRDFNAKTLDPSKESRYIAWVTSAGTLNAEVVDLGEAEAIDQLVQEIRRLIAADSSRTGAIAKDGEDTAVTELMKNMTVLSDQIWKPLAVHAGDAKQIILSPDGALWLVPWSALPASDNGDEYLLERYNIRMVISGRDLVVNTDKRTATPPVILANPDFDQQASQKKSAIQGIFGESSSENEIVTGSFSAKSPLSQVNPLPNTGIEALAIQPHIETYTNKKVGLYKEQYALERVAKVLRSPQIVTFATHGFFLPTQETKLEDRNLAMADNTRAVALDTNGQVIENPLLRCGLLLAGCNNREVTIADDDGILTGMEITGIDFRGTELVVLSACETGVGDVRNGEGVAGLRQAFQLAGAEAVMATLWQIPDRESAILMSSFFKHLADGQSKAEALRSAQIELIETRRDRYGAAHPFYWAAFTLTGN